MVKTVDESLGRHSPAVRAAISVFRNLRHVAAGEEPVFLDYWGDPTPRYGYGKPPHPELYRIINSGRDEYRRRLKRVWDLREFLSKIPVAEAKSCAEPWWVNDFMPSLDSAVLYEFLASGNPSTYLEVGSGISTLFARRAIRDHQLKTEVVSIDPHPRALVDSACDRVVRQPLEEADLSLFEDLDTGDIVFVDGSHRSLLNSDVTVLFLDVLPRLRRGVLVEIHDICLPYDYPPEIAKRLYSEQYLLAAVLLFGRKLEVVQPNFFVCQDEELGHVLEPLWNRAGLKGVRQHGVSFWTRVT